LPALPLKILFLLKLGSLVLKSEPFFHNLIKELPIASRLNPISFQISLELLGLPSLKSKRILGAVTLLANLYQTHSISFQRYKFDGINRDVKYKSAANKKQHLRNLFG